MKRNGFILAAALCAVMPVQQAAAAVTIPLTVNLSEAVTVTGSPQIAVDVGGTTRYAVYSGGSGTTALTFTLSPQPGDVDLDGVTVTSPIQLNGGTLKDAAGNDATLTFTPPNTSGIKIDYPSLKLDFINNDYVLSGTHYASLSAFLTAAGGTFSRSSSATYYDSSGILQTAAVNTPRFDYDPVTHAAKGLLIEEARTNLFIRSSELNNAAWVLVDATATADVTTAPDGTETADKLTETTAVTSTHSISESPTLTASTVYTYSVYAKAAERTWVLLTINTSANAGSYFNLSSGTLGSLIGTAAGKSARIENVGNGWYRCTLTAASSGSGVNSIALATGNNAHIYTGDGTSGLYVWGAQLEQGGFQTSYIPTTSATITRAADNVSLPTAAWYNQLAGSLYAEADTIPSNSGLSGAISLGFVNDGTANNEWGIRYDTGGTNLAAPFMFSAINQTTVYVSPVLSGLNKAVQSLSSGTRSAVANGGGVNTGTYTTAPTVTVLDIGRKQTGNYLNGWSTLLKYYPARIADAQLRLLTQ